MKNFNSFLTEAEDKKIITPEPKRVSDDIVTTFGRYNPPHLGHGRTLDHASKLAESIGDSAPADQRYYASKSNDPTKNPLQYDFKVKQLQKMFPQHAEKWDTDGNVRTVLNAAAKAHQEGYKNFHFVGGEDRKQDMENLLRRYNGNLYEFDNIYSHSAGKRKTEEELKRAQEEGEEVDPIELLSASNQRTFAQEDNFEEFAKGLGIGEHYTEDDAKELFIMLKNLMAPKAESWEVDHRNNREFIREQYAAGDLFQVGDLVESLGSGLRGRVHRCGANHLICVTENGIMFKSFAPDLQLV